MSVPYALHAAETPSRGRTSIFIIGNTSDAAANAKVIAEYGPHTENIYKVQEDLKAQRKLQSRTPGDAIDNQWIERGPNNVGGRTRTVFFDPNDATNETVFAGGVSGGLWKNTNISNSNSTWTRIEDLDNFSISCYAIDPNNSNIW